MKLKLKNTQAIRLKKGENKMNLKEALGILEYDIDQYWLVNAIKIDALTAYILKDWRALSECAYRMNEFKTRNKREKQDKQELVDAMKFLKNEIKENK